MIGLGTAFIISALAGLLGSFVNSGSQHFTNSQNRKMQNDINAQNQYNMEHAHQIEMADLEAAGLNPVLTATGGSGAKAATLSAPRNQAPQFDVSGIQSAVSMMMHMQMMQQMMDLKSDNLNATIEAANARNDARIAAANARNDARLNSYQVSKKDYSKYYFKGQKNFHSAKYAKDKTDIDDSDLPSWKDLMRMLGH